MSEVNAQPSMTRRRIVFFRTVTNDAGACGHCVIHTIHIRRARSTQRAVAAAQRRFERKFGVPAWDHLAHGYDVEEDVEEEV